MQNPVQGLSTLRGSSAELPEKRSSERYCPRTASRSLYLTVLLESPLPLVATALLAAVTGLVLAIPVANALAHGAPLQMPGHACGVTMGIGLAVCLAVIASTLPLPGRVTASDNARFE